MSTTNPLEIYNSLTDKKEMFNPLEDGKVRLYVCGPTVYDDAHLGHARCYITWDVLVRFLRFLGYDVTYARNITDVDDKILNRAKELGVPPQEVAEKNYESFKEDMLALNTLMPDEEPRATEYIEEMLKGIEALIENGSAYVSSDQSVYFRVLSKKDYGKLSKKPLDDLKAGARVDVDEEKESPMDFALWKSVSDEDSNAWDPASYQLKTDVIGRGRPGWHMECSAMNHGIFGDQIDIHAGGADLIFPHHENEIAQSECWTGEAPFSRYWMHNGFVNVSGEKMSKSLGNFSTIKKVLARYDSNTIRYFLLTNGYRMPVDFNDEALESAENWAKQRYKWLRKAAQKTEYKAENKAVLTESYSALCQIKSDDGLDGPADFMAAVNFMLDDLNTAEALKHLNAMMSRLNTVENPENLKTLLHSALSLWQLLGFDFSFLNTDDEIAISKDDLAKLLTDRKIAKAEKNWAVADSIRDELVSAGLQLLDNKDGTTSLEKEGVEIVRV